METTASILGFVAAFCTTVSFIPQALRVIKTKHTKDLSLAMYSMFNIGILLWLLYGIVIVSWPMILANGITFLLTSTILYLKIRYK
ncbi:SemiSWEET transporter [Labilibaculum sp. K2S]|uniref:SemiSWEET transporter n=1 Tax=Labilibaculum sp. K2S TaxID=3056386 RepID=UPI0025A3DFA1|nr:SemiSWEET transporter [Labilibaculum sp. K2S]MDM8160624.1 SemiSWEET transporter [Labilibaculum sp. K2S]